MSDHHLPDPHLADPHVPDPNDPQAWARLRRRLPQLRPQQRRVDRRYLGNIRSYPVLPNIHPGELVDALPARAPEQGESFDAILDDFRTQILPAVTQWNHPGFMAYFGTSPPPPESSPRC